MKSFLLLFNALLISVFLGCGSSSEGGRDVLTHNLKLIGIPPEIVVNVCQDSNDNGSCDVGELQAKIKVNKNDSIKQMWEKVKFDAEGNYILEHYDKTKNIIMEIDGRKHAEYNNVDLALKYKPTTNELSVLQAVVDADFLKEEEVEKLKALPNREEVDIILFNSLTKNQRLLEEQNLTKETALTINLEEIAKGLIESNVSKELPEQLSACQNDNSCIKEIIENTSEQVELTKEEAQELARSKNIVDAYIIKLLKPIKATCANGKTYLSSLEVGEKGKINFEKFPVGTECNITVPSGATIDSNNNGKLDKEDKLLSFDMMGSADATHITPLTTLLFKKRLKGESVSRFANMIDNFDPVTAPERVVTNSGIEKIKIEKIILLSEVLKSSMRQFADITQIDLSQIVVTKSDETIDDLSIERLISKLPSDIKDSLRTKANETRKLVKMLKDLDPTKVSLNNFFVSFSDGGKSINDALEESLLVTLPKGTTLLDFIIKPKFDDDKEAEAPTQEAINEIKDNIKDDLDSINNPPVADAGDDQNLTQGDSLILDGSNSSDSDGDIQSYEWWVNEKLLDNGASITIEDLSVGIHVITLVVTDNKGAVGSDTLLVTVNKKEIVVDDNVTNPIDDNVTNPIDDNVTNPTDDNVTNPTDDNVTNPIDDNVTNPTDDNITNPTDDNITNPTDDNITNPTDDNVTNPTDDNVTNPTDDNVTNPTDDNVTNPTDDNVTNPTDDNITNPTDDNITNPTDDNVTTPNQPPVANAGADQNVTVGDVVHFDGSKSSDINGSIISYEWREGNSIIGSGVSFDKSDLTVGLHTITLTVTDNENATASDSVVITVNETPNQSPIANAGADQTVTEGDSVYFDGSASSDSDGNITAYEWKNGDTVVSTEVSFYSTDLSVGTHTITLTVTDDRGATASDDVIITVNEAPQTEKNVADGYLIKLASSATAYCSDKEYSSLLTVGEEGKITFNGVALTSDCHISIASGATIDSNNNGILDANDTVLNFAMKGSAEGSFISPLTTMLLEKEANGEDVTQLKAMVQNFDPVICATAIANGSGVDKVVNEKLMVMMEVLKTALSQSPDANISDINISGLIQTDANETIDDFNTDALTTTFSPDLQSLIYSQADKIKKLVKTFPSLDPTKIDINSFYINISDGKVNIEDAIRASAKVTIEADDNLLVLISRPESNMTAIYEEFVAMDIGTLTSMNRPVAKAGADITVMEGLDVNLSAMGSFDIDGYITQYVWTEGNVTISPIALVSKNDFTVGEHNLTLTVTDNDGNKDSDEVTITVNAINLPPVADAGGDRNITFGTSVTLDGTASYDINGTISSYRWYRTSGTEELLSSEASFTLNNLSVGVYDITLEVTDNEGAIALDNILITVIEENEISKLFVNGQENNTSFGAVLEKGSKLEDVNLLFVPIIDLTKGSSFTALFTNGGFEDLETITLCSQNNPVGGIISKGNSYNVEEGILIDAQFQFYTDVNELFIQKDSNISIHETEDCNSPQPAIVTNSAENEIVTLKFDNGLTDNGLSLPDMNTNSVTIATVVGSLFSTIGSNTDALYSPNGGEVWEYDTNQTISWNGDIMEGYVDLYILHDDPTNLAEFSSSSTELLNSKNWYKFASNIYDNNLSINPKDLNGDGDAYIILIVAELGAWDISDNTFSLVNNTISYTLKKTGQTKSYDENGTEVTDGSLKDDGFYQKGLDHNYTRDADKETVTDLLTGLMWQDDPAVSSVIKQWLTQANYDTCSNDTSDPACFDTSGDTTATTYCNDLNLSGYSDWRLPTRTELQGIVDYGRYDPAINSVFVNTNSSPYWSSTTNANYNGNAWIVYFYYGSQDYSPKGNSNYVRCVRAGQ